MVLAHEPRRLALLPAEGPHHAHAAEHLGRLAIDLLAFFANVAEQRPDSAIPEQVGIVNPRHQQKCPEQEPPVDPGEHDHTAQKLDDAPARDYRAC